MVAKIVQAAEWAVRAESAVVQLPLGGLRPECVHLGVRQLTQNGDPIRDGAIVKTVRVASPGCTFTGCVSASLIFCTFSIDAV